MSEEQTALEQEMEGSIQQKEEQMLEKAGVKLEDNTYKIDLRNAVQEQSTDEVSVRNEPETSEKVEEEVRSTEEPSEQKEEVLELIKEDNDGLQVQEQEDDSKKNVEQENFVQEKEEVVQQLIPEGLDKVVEFMNETGGTLEDYVRINADYSNVDEQTLLREYYKQTKSHLDNEEINFLIEDSFSYDEDIEDDRDIKRKKLAYKEEISKARQHLNSLKDKYYNEVKSSVKLTEEQKQAVNFYNEYNKQQEELTVVQQKQAEHFTKLTDNVFNNDFKGFDFKVGENKYRFKVNDVQQTKEVQSDILNSFKTFLDDNNMLQDAQGYHKALFAARNADTIANHFYQQGRADALKQLDAESKNINMDPRKTSTGVVEAGGIKVKAISGDNSSKLRFKIRK